MAQLCERKCGKCINVREAKTGLERVDEAEDTIIDEALDDDLEQRLGSYIDNNLLATTPLAGLSPAEATVAVRKRTAEVIEEYDVMREGVITTVNQLTADCPGPLKMRATKAGQTVMATICMSPAGATLGESVEHVIVERTPAES